MAPFCKQKKKIHTFLILCDVLLENVASCVPVYVECRIKEVSYLKQFLKHTCLPNKQGKEGKKKSENATIIINNVTKIS